MQAHGRGMCPDQMPSGAEAQGTTAGGVADVRTPAACACARLPYFEARGIPDDLPRFMASLHERAGGGAAGEHAHADVSRLQELMRPRAPAAAAKRARSPSPAGGQVGGV